MAARRKRKEIKFTERMKKRLLFIFLLAAALLIILSFILIRINSRKGDAYSKQVYDNFNYDSRVIPARRGDITDRNGTILAYSTKVYNLIIDTKVLLSWGEDYKDATVDAICSQFDVDKDELLQYIEDNPKSSYKRLTNALKAEDIEDIQGMIAEKKSKIKGVWFEEQYARTYPFNTVAADTIGFASEANGGELGIESYYEKYLAGTNGRKYGYIDSSEYKTNVIPATNGDTVVSTIDYNIQSIIEKAIKDFNDQYGSISTSVLVMDPNTGELLGMADYPTFDLNNPRDISSVYTDEELDELDDKGKLDALYSVWSNNCVSKIYEPGSVFKTFTIAQAIEENDVKNSDVFNCDGRGVYNNATILCHGGIGHGDLTVTGSLAESCNDILMQIGEKIGKPMFCRYLDIFKIGQKTGIDLPSEEAGLTIAEDKMMDVDLATNCFGQNLDVTMVQIASSFASVINGGNLYKPHVVKEIQSATGQAIKKIEPQLITKTISKETSEMMQEILRTVVDYGTGGYTYRAGYSIGAKTGTAEKYPRDKQSYVVSYMGFAPAEDPEVLIYVVVDAPDCEDFASSWAAQMIANQIFDGLLPYENIYADNADYDVDVYLDTTGEKAVTKRPIAEPEPPKQVDEKPGDVQDGEDEDESATGDTTEDSKASENEDTNNKDQNEPE